MDNLPKLDARVRPYQDPSDRPTKLMAFAELLIADAFVIKGIRVLKKAEPGNDEPFVVFPAEGHWILKPLNSRAWYGEVLAWLNKYL